MNDWETLVGELRDLPQLDGARCRGRAELFDATQAGRPHDVEYARTAALNLCLRCPALRACRSWLDNLPAERQPLGVVAGQIITPGKQSSFQRERAQRAELFASLHRKGLTIPEIAATTGASKSDVRRLLTQPPTTHPNERIDMTKTIAADHRRATSLVVHYGHHSIDGHNLDGINAILSEAVETTRITPLFVAVLDLHEGIVPILLTADGLACASHMVYTLTEDDDADTTRAAQLITAHSQRDADTFNALMRQAADVSRVTELLMAVLAVCRTVVPQLYCELGLKVLERSALDWAALECDGDK